MPPSRDARSLHANADLATRMRQLERRLQDRFPAAFRGRRARLTLPVLNVLGRLSGFDRIAGFLSGNGHLRGFDFIGAALDFLQARYTVDPVELARIPRSGRLLIIANHPSGALDALALLHAVGRVRGDVRIVANDVLSAIDGFEGLLLPVRILGGRPDPASLQAIEASLQAEQCVIVFPAGEVARLGMRGVRDGRWRRGFLRFARAAHAPVLPIRVEARNSALFYGASAVFKPIGTALLAREMFARRQRPLNLRVGHAVRLPAHADDSALLAAMRDELQAIGTSRAGHALAMVDGPVTELVIDPVDPARVQAQVRALELLGITADGKQIRAGRLAAGNALLQEIGRLRELTFRAVGEGTGRRLDVDVYDTWYDHIVLWDEAGMRIAGAYRVARGAQVLAERGLGGLYTASLFRYGDDAIARIAAGMELGRSFVAQAYWGGRSIDYLWQGIGAYLARHPKVRYLFGPVSISAALPADAREQIVAYYTRFHGDLAGDAAEARMPFAYRAAPPDFGALDATTALRVLRQNLDALGATVPMLYKQYVDLCEPDGVRFLAFGVDPAFSDAVDGLIEVDIARIRPAKHARYIARPRVAAGAVA